jgi:CheY-like chemotaxis protein
MIRGKILAVDDEPDHLELLHQLLQEEGFTIDTAANGADALSKIERSRPDLIVADISMPKMNGFTLCERLQENPATAAIPVLILTGHGSHFNRLNGFAHGASAFLTKPYKPDELISAVRKALGAAPQSPPASARGN